MVDGDEDNGRTLVGMAKRWPQPLYRGLTSHSFLQIISRLVTGHLIEGGGLIGGRLMEVQLYTAKILRASKLHRAVSTFLPVLWY